MDNLQFAEETYNKIKETISAFDEAKLSDIYGLSFFASMGEDDPRMPMLTVGYNTMERFRACTPAPGQEPDWPIASNVQEAKWNYAFWLQNEVLVIGGYEYNPVEEWVKNSPFYYTDDQEIHDFDEAVELGEQIYEGFITIVIANARRLHEEGVITAKFGREVPIIVHELEYYKKPLEWTRRANPEGLAGEFEAWIGSFSEEPNELNEEIDEE